MDLYKEYKEFLEFKRMKRMLDAPAFVPSSASSVVSSVVSEPEFKHNVGPYCHNKSTEHFVRSLFQGRIPLIGNKYMDLYKMLYQANPSVFTVMSDPHASRGETELHIGVMVRFTPNWNHRLHLYVDITEEYKIWINRITLEESAGNYVLIGWKCVKAE